MLTQRFCGRPVARRFRWFIRDPPSCKKVNMDSTNTFPLPRAGGGEEIYAMRNYRSHTLTAAVVFAPFLALPTVGEAATVTNPICPTEFALFNPDTGNDIVVPKGFKVSVFKSGLNFPTGIAFLGNSQRFEVYVLESGHGLPSICNEQDSVKVGGTFDPNNPFTPDILVFNQAGTQLRKLAKPTATGGGFQAAGPAVDIAFERGLQGGRLFASDSNQATHAAGQNNSSRIVTVDPTTGKVTPFITGLPTGDHTVRVRR